MLSAPPDHGPTLIRCAANLIELFQCEEASRVLDRAQAVVPAGRLHLVVAQRGHLAVEKGDLAAGIGHFL